MRPMVVLSMVFLLVTLIIAGCASSQPDRKPLQVGDHVKVVPGPVGEFRRDSIGIKCTMINKMEFHYQSCLKIGPLAIGADLSSVEAKLGKPGRMVPQPDGTEARVYAIRMTDLGDRKVRLWTYWVVTHRGGKVTAIQLTGEPPKEDFAFSSNRLGDPVEQLRQRLGQPSSKTPVPEGNAVSWNYWPFPFSFEIKDRVIYSIRIAEQVPTNQLFIPLPDSAD